MNRVPIDGWIIALATVAMHVLTFQFWRWYNTLRYVTKPIDGPIPEEERVTIEGKIRAGPELVPAPDDPDDMCVAWVARDKDPGFPHDSRNVRIRPFVLERTHGEPIWLLFSGIGFFPGRTREKVVNLRDADKPQVRAFTTALGHAWNEREARVAERAKKWRDYDAPLLCRPEDYEPPVFRFLVTTYHAGDTITVTGRFRPAVLDGPPERYRGTSASDLAVYEFYHSAKHRAAMTQGSYADVRSLRNPGNWTCALYTVIFAPMLSGMLYFIAQLVLIVTVGLPR